MYIKDDIKDVPWKIAETKRLFLPSMTLEKILWLTVVRLRVRSYILAVIEAN